MNKNKFRLWNKKQKRIEKTDSDSYAISLGMFSDYYLILGFNGEIVERKIGDVDHREDVSDDYILIQFTGLKDKNGVEIYENDIVKWSSLKIGTCKEGFENNYDYKNRIVNWSENKGCWILDDEENWNLGIYDNIEVIGNIYEHSELLTK